MRLCVFDKFGLCFSLFLLSISVKGQDVVPNYETQRAFACIILDNNTSQPLEKATLRIGRYGWSADEAGRVEALASIGDAITFTHVGYNPVSLSVSDSLFSQNIVAVSLSPDTISLSEIVVYPRRLNLKEEAAMYSAQRGKVDVIAKQLFATSTYEALSTPSSFDDWSAVDNQKNTLNKFNRQIEYKGMIPPEQMIGVSNIVIRAIAALIKKISDRPYRNSAVRPLSAEELNLILKEYNYEASEEVISQE